MTAPEITPQIRQAVLDLLCEERGHDLDIAKVATVEDRGRRIGGTTEAMPHLECRLCGSVWIVDRFGGRNYNQAQRRHRERLLPGDPDALPPP